MSKAVTKKEDNLPSAIEDEIFETAGDGIDYDTSELQIPFLRLAQSSSPQLIKSDPKFISGCSQGDMFNTVTGQYWDGEEGVTVIPCYQETKYLEFIPREKGGGFVGEVAPDNPAIKQAKREGNKEILSNGNELVKSDQHYCIVIDGDIPQLAIMDMKVSQLKVSRRWKTQIAMQKVKDKNGILRVPAVYATMWKFKSVEESNDQGTFFNWTFDRVGFVQDKGLFEEARKFRESVMKGEAKARAEDIVDQPMATKEDDDHF